MASADFNFSRPYCVKVTKLSMEQIKNSALPTRECAFLTYPEATIQPQELDYYPKKINILKYEKNMVDLTLFSSLNLNVTVSDLINSTNITELAEYIHLIQELL